MSTAILLFVLAAVSGVYLAMRHLGDRHVAPAGALAHGAFAAAGLVALILAAGGGAASGTVMASLGLFVVTALGGFVLFALHLRGQPLPRPLIYVHGLAAAVAFVLLLAGSGLW